MNTARRPLRSLKAISLGICVVCVVNILYWLLLKERHRVQSVRLIKEKDNQVRNAEPEDITSVNLQLADIIKGPEAYQEKLEKALADYIKLHFLLPPSDQPYNLTNGLDPEKHNGQLGQPIIIDKILKGQTNGFFVECGSYNGEVHSNSLFFELKRNWTGLLVEPNSKMFAELTSKNRKAYAVNGCLSLHNYAQEAEFFNARKVGSLQELPVPKVIALLRNRSSVIKQTFMSKAQCFPFFSLLLAMGNPVVDLFSLDVEGAEMGVLQTIPWHRVNIRLILLEVLHGDRAALDAFLNSKGYDLHKNIRMLDSIYIKRDQRASMDLN